MIQRGALGVEIQGVWGVRGLGCLVVEGDIVCRGLGGVVWGSWIFGSLECQGLEGPWGAEI